MLQTIKFYTLTIVILGLAGLALYFWFRLQHAVTRRTVDAPAIVQQIQRLNELVTVKYSIQKAIGLEEQKVPFGTEKVLILVQAKVKAGVNMQNATLSLGDETATVRLPAPIITDVYIDDHETKVWNRNISWWAVWVSPNPDLEQSARRAALTSVRIAAEQMGILSNAQSNAELAIRELLTAAGFKAVQFEVAAGK